jgi:hypothetical protein
MDTENTGASLSAKAEAAFRRAAEEVVRRAMQTGTPIIVWKDGRIEKIPSDRVDLAPIDKQRGGPATSDGID